MDNLPTTNGQPTDNPRQGIHFTHTPNLACPSHRCLPTCMPRRCVSAAASADTRAEARAALVARPSHRKRGASGSAAAAALAGVAPLPAAAAAAEACR